MIDLMVTPLARQINSAPSLSEVFNLAFLTADCQLGQLLISVKIDQTSTADAFMMIFCLFIMGAFVLILIFMICAYVPLKVVQVFYNGTPRRRNGIFYVAGCIATIKLP